MPLRGLVRRSDYLAANAGRRAPMPAFVLLVRPRGDGDPAMGVGLTVTKKIGSAVVRNRIKRRFRELVRAVLPEAGLAGADHVLIGRSAATTRDFAQLGEDLRKALRKTATPYSGAVRRPEPQAPRRASLDPGLRRGTTGNGDA
jgi:ribonuclease P protein component